MIIDATFWVAVSFFIFFGCLVYLKIPQKINNSLTDQINKIAVEVSSELIRQIVGAEMNMSKVSAIVDDISKKKIEKHL